MIISPLLIPIFALSIPIIAIVSRHIQKTQSNRLNEKQLEKEILMLEIEKQNSKIKLLEEENKHLDMMIYNS